jgi:hypothetical protein
MDKRQGDEVVAKGALPVLPIGTTRAIGALGAAGGQK